MRALLLSLLTAGAALAQPFGFGLKVGAPLTDFINNVQSGSLSSNTNRYIIGATAELRLPFGVSIEGDVLYRHFSYDFLTVIPGVGSTPSTQVGTSTTSNAWEFPLLLKYKFPSHIVRPYLDAGVAWDTLQGLKASITTLTPVNGVGSNTTATTSTSNPTELQNSTTMGAVIGAGLDIKALIIHISPEIRYTRWTSQHFNAANLLNSNQNQAEFLLGITF